MDASGVRVRGRFADGSGATARFDGPAGLAFDHDALLIADARNHCIRQFKNGFVTTFAGVCGQIGKTDGTVDAARFGMPFGVAVLPNGDVYVADRQTGLRRVDAKGIVTTIGIPLTTAYGLAYEPTSETLYVTAKEGIFLIRNGAATGIRYGDAALPGSPASHLSFGYDIGNPLGIVALDRFTILYSDAETGALKYLEGYTGSAEVLSGAPAGGDYRVTGREDGPLGPRSFVQPLDLTLAPDRGVLIADGLGRVVRRIAPWTAQVLSIPADVSVPHWDAHRFRIAYIGNSTIWSGAAWYDSIESRLQTALDTPAFRAAHGVPEVQPFWIVDVSQFPAAADYGTFLIENHLADAVIVQQSSISLFNPAPRPPTMCGGLDFTAPWSASEASTKRLGEAARRDSVAVVGVIAPDALDISPAESLLWTITPGQNEKCDMGLVEQKRKFHSLALALLAAARIPSVDLWPTFIAAEERSDSHPLFGSFDGHFTADGRASGGAGGTTRSASDARPHEVTASQL